MAFVVFIAVDLGNVPSRGAETCDRLDEVKVRFLKHRCPLSETHHPEGMTTLTIPILRPATSSTAFKKRPKSKKASVVGLKTCSPSSTRKSPWKASGSSAVIPRCEGCGAYRGELMSSLIFPAPRFKLKSAK